MRRADSLEKTLMLGKTEGGRRRGMTEDEMVRWHHRLHGHKFEQAPGAGDGQGGLACCSPWGCRESDTTQRLNSNQAEGTARPAWRPLGGWAGCVELAAGGAGALVLLSGCLRPVPSLGWRWGHLGGDTPSAAVGGVEFFIELPTAVCSHHGEAAVACTLQLHHRQDP